MHLVVSVCMFVCLSVCLHALSCNQWVYADNGTDAVDWLLIWEYFRQTSPSQIANSDSAGTTPNEDSLLLSTR